MTLKRSKLAGTWYPSDPVELGGQINQWLDEAPEGAPALGVVVPHAGYKYSGMVAAAGYRRLRAAACKRVVILAPSHRFSFHGVVALEIDAFETPLGRVAVDPVMAGLVDGHLVRADPRPFEDEHSLEIQIPFIQAVQPAAAVVPLLFGHMNRTDFREFAFILSHLADEHTSFAVSSDFTHYGPRFGYEPFSPDNADSVRSKLRELDMGAIGPAVRGDADAFVDYLDRTGATVCGRVPVTAFLTWAGPQHQGELLAYRTSLDITGDYDHVVSYAAIGFPRRGR